MDTCRPDWSERPENGGVPLSSGCGRTGARSCRPRTERPPVTEIPPPPGWARSEGRPLRLFAERLRAPISLNGADFAVVRRSRVAAWGGAPRNSLWFGGRARPLRAHARVPPVLAALAPDL